jgi:hypothetical protein
MEFIHRRDIVVTLLAIPGEIILFKNMVSFMHGSYMEEKY